MVRDREAWHAAVHGVAKRWQDWATEEQHASLDLRFTFTPYFQHFSFVWKSSSLSFYCSNVSFRTHVLLTSWILPCFPEVPFPHSVAAYYVCLSPFFHVLLLHLSYAFTPTTIWASWGMKVNESCSVVSDSLWLHGLYIPCNSRGRILEWVAGPFSRGSPQPRDRTQVSHITGGFFTVWAMREGHLEASSMSYL